MRFNEDEDIDTGKGGKAGDEGEYNEEAIKIDEDRTLPSWLRLLF